MWSPYFNNKWIWGIARLQKKCSWPGDWKHEVTQVGEPCDGWPFHKNVKAKTIVTLGLATITMIVP